MAYSLTYSGGTITVTDGTLNTTSTSLSLPGRNYAGYGSPVDQNLVSMLENFASSTGGPANPIRGQLWFDTSINTLNVNYNGTISGWVGLVTENSDAVLGDITVDSITTPVIDDGGAGGTIVGTWVLDPGSTLQATYADLAERFAADAEYEPGTVVQLGGDHEITAVREDASDDVFGVISNTAGYIMNARAGSDATHPPIAMTGRVNVKVIGTVKKGDRLISAGGGIARAARKGEATPFNIIGRALENKETDKLGKVLAAVSAKL